MVIDVFTFNGEYDMLEIRLNILDEYVDQFVIVEALTTFTGHPKPLYYLLNEERYAKWAHKIKHYLVDDEYTEEEIALAENSPNTGGAAHWVHEFLQKESIKKALTHLKDSDIVFIGDVDEIWDEDKFHLDILAVIKLKLRVYTYYLNNKSNEEFWGTIVGRYKDIKDECLNHLRSGGDKVEELLCGWHFTNMGGVDEVRRKLNDSYTEDSYNTQEVQDKLEERFGKSDYIGRGFKFTVDESELPEWLLENKSNYKHLWMTTEK